MRLIKIDCLSLTVPTVTLINIADSKEYTNKYFIERFSTQWTEDDIECG